MSEDEGITVKKDENYSEWYNQVVLRAELADFSPVKGCMVIRPYGYRIWEKIQSYLDGRIKETGHMNAYFPLFIPESLLTKESEHVEGFSPEVAWVTHGGDTKLEERLAIRPTSETIMYTMYAKWVRSYRDLPLLINQWANVVRWETKMTKLFMRTREFLWQEGHTVHATEEEAAEEVMRMLHVYKDVYEHLLAIPVIIGTKTDKEKFAGAKYTTTCELLMPDKRAVQGGTSHHLGQNFSKVFDISFTDKDEQQKYAWNTSWGLSTRTIASLIMMHGDDKGLVLPPSVAPISAVIVPIIFKKDREAVLEAARSLRDALSGFVVELDDREEYSAGYKFNHWEVRGVPVRIEIGPRDVKNGQVVFVRRDTGTKRSVSIDNVSGELRRELDDVQTALYERAHTFLEENTHVVKDYDTFMRLMSENGGGMLKVQWCGSTGCEEAIKDETGATSSCIPFGEEPSGTCIYCGEPAREVVYFAKHY
ncbi:proline--tRNA ligase [archaeon]|nr:MAG: proline--tRNA ligase [archaeon]